MSVHSALAGTIAVAALAVGAPASAAIVLTAGNMGGVGVHSDPHQNSATATGHVGGHADGPLVTFTTTDDALLTGGNGESKWEAADGSMNDLSILFSENYDAITFNLITDHSIDSSMVLSVNGGAQVFTAPGDPGFASLLSNGENKFIVSATEGDFITSLDFTFDPGIHDIRQIRVGSVVGPGGILGPPGGQFGVPEPASWALMMLGFGAAGAILRRRRVPVPV
jgi:hypothetical protein